MDKREKYEFLMLKSKDHPQVQIQVNKYSNCPFSVLELYWSMLMLRSSDFT